MDAKYSNIFWHQGVKLFDDSGKSGKRQKGTLLKAKEAKGDVA